MSLPSALRRIPLPLLAFAAVLLVHGAWAARLQIQMAPDSRFYSLCADLLLELRWDYGAFFRSSDTLRPPVQYAGFITLVALCKTLFGAGWVYACAALNLLAQAMVAAQLVSLVQRLTRSGAASAAALLLYLSCYDILMWTSYPLTDPLFLALSFSLFAYLAVGLLEERPPRLPAYAGGASALLLLCLLWRPTAPALLPVAGTAFWLRWRWEVSLRSPKAQVRFRRVAGALAGASLGVMGLYALLMQHPDWWPFRVEARTIQFFAAAYQEGEVVVGRPETYHAPPQVFLDYLAIVVDRLLHFFYFAARGFSRMHKILGAAWFLPVYLLSGVTLAALLRERSPWGEAGTRVVTLSAVTVIGVSVFHALLLVDYDWRYRVPVLPHLMLLAALGLTLVIRPAGARAGREAAGTEA